MHRSHFTRVVGSVALFFLYGSTVGAQPTVSNVLASQRSGTKSVDVSYDLAHAQGKASTVALLASQDGGATWTAVSSVTGAVGAGVVPGTGKSIVWNAGADWPAELFPAVKVRVTAAAGGGGPSPAGFSLIEADTFTMGSPSSELGRDSDETQHIVTLTRSFHLAKTEVTWAQWNAVRASAVARGYTDIATGRNGKNGDVSGEHPVTEVSWWDVIKWCNLRSELEGKTPVYYTSSGFGSANILRTGTPTPYADWDANGYRLPTEAEWEYACRAGTTTAFYNGAITHTGSSPIDPNLDQVGWYGGNSGSNTHPVGGKVANAWELYDMHGNVWEWCWDWYASSYGSDLEGPASGSLRVVRGGGWFSSAQYCRSAYRSWYGPDYRYNYVGFRPALTAVP